MKLHRLLIFCFLFSFAGQQVLTFGFSKKAIIECCDSDDDSDGSENSEKEVWDSFIVSLNNDFTIYFENPAVLIAWKLVSPVSTEWRNAIDNPPEIS